jgi:hypothetical protein
MPEDIITQGLPHKKLKPALDKIKGRVFKNKVVRDMLNKYDIDESELDLVPMCFAKLPVSARTDHGVIYINIDLAQDGNIVEDDHYIAHELTHYCQQTTGNKPTPTADPDKYLDSPVEQEGFRNQSRYIADTKGEEAAEDYIDDVLDYHEKTKVDKKKRKDRKDCLLAVARDFDVDLSEFA